MNEFRQALEAYLAGRTDIDTLENTLRSSVQRQPHLAAAHSAIIDAMFRSKRLGAPARDLLLRVVQGAGQAVPPAPTPPAQPTPPPPSDDRTQFRAAPATSTPPTPPLPPAESSDKTQFRMPPAPPRAAPPTPPPEASSEKTQFRMPRPGPQRPTPSAPAAPPAPAVPPAPAAPPPTPVQSAPPLPPAAHADRTQLRSKPLATGPSPGVTPPRPPPPAPPPGKTPGASASKPGLLSDLLGTADGDEPGDAPESVPTPVPAPSAPITSSPTTTGGTGPVTGTGPSTGTGNGTGGWTGGTGSSTGRRTGAGSGGSWSNLAGDGSAAPLAPGDTIKERFVLEDIIGKGGMGIVFKARDLRWEEAQDRHPYVAVKVLNEDFKRHPESLKALQRESRKAQNLAHPNVVTVYQFDRDGANVFMVMELLEGEPLDRVIKRNDAGGLPPKTALKYTAHMARALAYAHEQGIVHSDFKPANAYLTRDGIVKVFDFGIARAAKRSDKVSGSMTLFDPGTLGALTPAYASCEMIEGLEPDPRDDIYALACVFYELLTGKHPYGKQSAVQARDAKMVPAPVPGLSRSQWRGLARGLSFSRTQRTASVMEFLNEISPRRTSPVKWIAIAASVAVLTVAIILFLPGYLERRRTQEIADVFRRGEDATVPEALERLGKLTDEQRGDVFRDSAARDGLLSYFERQIDAATDEKKRKYDFPRAFALIAQAEKIFSDSSRVENKKKSLTERQDDVINRLTRQFDEALKRGLLVDKQDPDNASRLLEVLAQAKPDLSLQTYSQSLLIAYVEQAGAALDRGNVALADELINTGLKRAPQDTSLKELAYRARAAAANQQTAQRVKALLASIDTGLGTAPTLEGFDRKRAELVELRSVANDNTALARWQSQLQVLLDRRLNELANARSFSDAEAMLGNYADLASARYVADRRDALNTARKEFTERVARLTNSLHEAINAGRLGPPAPNNARSFYQALDRAGANPEQLAMAKDEISNAYLRQARELRSRGGFAEARRLVAAGLDVGPTPPVAGVLRDETKEIDDAEKLAATAADAQLRAQLAAQRAKDDDDLKAKLAVALKTPKQTIESARSALQLVEKLQTRGVKDPMVQNARRDIQNQLLVEIRLMIEKGGPDSAIRFTEQASALLPESTALNSVLAEVRKASADSQVQARTAAITAIKTNIDTLVKTPKLDDKWLRDTNAELRKLSAYLPDNDPYVVGVKRSMSNAYIAAARKSRDAKSLSEAERMLERAAELTPTHPDLASEQKLLAEAKVLQGRAVQQAKLAADTESLKQRLLVQAKADDTNFLATLSALKQTLPANDTFISQEAPIAMADSYLRLASKACGRGSWDEAITLLDRGLENAQGLVKLRERRALYANLRSISEQINSGSSLSAKDVRTNLDALSKTEPALYAVVAKRFQNALEARVRTEGNRNPALATNFESAMHQIFPETRVAATRPPAGTTAVGSATTPPTATPMQSPTGAASQPQPTAAVQPGGSAVVEPAATAPAATPAAGAAPGKPCLVGYKGAGKSPRAVCYDGVIGGRGPDLVVIPEGGPFPGPAVVSRYELSNADYNLYCTNTGRCKPVSGDAKLPLVDVGVADGERYVTWLTEVTGKKYRLPTDTEWSYIASGGGAIDRNDINCTVEANGSKVKGFSLSDKNIGPTSNWGVYNIVGNAQEWAKAPGGWVVRGGSYQENVSNCNATYGRAHNGAPDGKTGFRLIREF